MSLGTRFKLLRAEKNLTQTELAKEFNKKYDRNFTTAAISNYENDKRIPEIEALQDFADYFEVSVDYLLGRSLSRKEIQEYDDEVVILARDANELTETQRNIIIDMIKEFKKSNQ